MPGKLSARRETFAQEYVATGNATQAAITAGYAASGARTEGARLLANANVAARIADIRGPVVEAAQITLASHLSTLEELREAAKEAGQHGAAISAEVARGKASGLYTEKREVTFPKGGGVLMVPTPISPADWAAQVAARQASLTASEGQ